MALDLTEITFDLFYQILLEDYGNFSLIKIDPPIDVSSVISIADLDIPEQNQKNLLQKMIKMRLMLEDYFAIRIDEDGRISGMPVLVENYTPSFHRIHSFLEEISVLNWKKEKDCLGGIARALARLYSLSEEVDSLYAEEEPHWNRIIEYNIISLLKSGVYIPTVMKEKPFSALTSLPLLYKVFERC